MSANGLIFEKKDNIAILTLDRPERRNALSLALMRSIIGVVEELKADNSVAALVIKANGPAFSAGHDLSEMQGREAAEYREIFHTCTEMMQGIRELPQIVIAQVNGIATAAGCQLVATCDLAVAEHGVRFGTPGVKIGLFCSTPMVPLTRAVGRKKALEMLMTGELMDAEEALRCGLVNKVVPAEALEEETLALAGRIAAASPFTLALGKSAFYKQADFSEPDAYAYAKEVMSLNAMAADAQEGMCAFLEKRKPEWKGR